MQGKGCLARVLALLAALLAIAPAAARGEPGDLDPAFGGGDGRVALASAGAFVARAVEVDAEDRIVVGGYLCEPDPVTRDGTCLSSGNTSFRIARLTPDGGLDAEFGVNGFVTTPVGDGRSESLDLIVTGDDTIVAAGVARSSGRDVFALARYRSDGSLDPAFGDGGIVLAPVGAAFASLSDVSPGPRGTIIAAGQAVDPAGIPRMAVARFSSAGRLDPSFGAGGVTLGGMGAFGYGLGVAVSRNGSALVAGLAGDSADPATYRFSELAVRSNGRPDRSFGDEGSARQDVGFSSSFANAAAHIAGGWLAAGAATVADGRQAMAVVRGRGDGALDQRFGREGHRLIPLLDGAVANDLLADRDGNAVLVGQAARGGGYGFAVVRLRRNGGLDRSFGGGGKRILRWPGFPIARATAGARQGSGDLVTVGIGCVGGISANCSGGTSRLLVARLQGVDRTAPAIRVGRARRLGPRRIGVQVALSEPARLVAHLRARGRLISARVWPRAHAAFTVRLRAPRRLNGRRLKVSLRAADAAGNAATRRFTVRLRR